MIAVHLHEEIIMDIIGEVALLTDLGEDLDSVLNRVKEAFIDTVNVGILTALFLHEQSQKEG